MSINSWIAKHKLKKQIYKSIKEAKVRDELGVHLAITPSFSSSRDKFLHQQSLLKDFLTDLSNKLKKDNIDSWILSRATSGLVYDEETNTIRAYYPEFFAFDILRYGWGNIANQEEYGGYWLILEWGKNEIK